MKIKVEWEVEPTDSFFYVDSEDFEGMTEGQIASSIDEQIQWHADNGVDAFCRELEAITEQIFAEISKPEAA